jgi:hypothetical protein
MVGRNLTDDGLVSLHWNNPAGPDVLAEIRRTSTARDVREALVALAYAVGTAPRPANGLCVIADSRLSGARLRSELDRFRAIVRPDLAARLYLAAAKTGEVMYLDGESPETSQSFMKALFDAVREEGAVAGATRVTRQQVKAALVERALWGLAPLTLADLRRLTGASYQTANAALIELQKLGVVTGERDGPIVLHGLRPLALRKLADEHAGARKSVRFVDPTGNARMPSAMADRLLSLRSKQGASKVTISGVLGATRYFPDLNITAAPRLDLSVYDGDQRFVAKLDAGLLRTDDQNRKPALVLHMQRDCRPPEIADKEPELAAKLDCLADLEELGLRAEAEAFAYELCETARKAP